MENTNEISATIERLQQKLLHLRQAAGEPQYALNPCLTEDEVCVFEQRHAITLPIDYRAFILHIGNGGAGPFPIFPLTEALISTEPDFLSQPFPYIQWWNGMTPSDWFDRNMTAEEMDQIVKEDGYYDEHHMRGTLRLAHEGCGYYVHLVINGPERGHVWTDLRAGGAGIGPWPHYLSTHRLSFSQWYEQWLDSILTQHD